MKKLIFLILGLTLFSIPAYAQNAPETTTTPEELKFEEKFRLLFPSQQQLFDESKRLDLNRDGIISEEERARLADGDLEQGLAPRIVQLLIRFSTIAFFIVLTIAGVRLILSRGNEEELTKTKEVLVQVIIGSVLITASFGIIYGIINLFRSFL